MNSHTTKKEDTSSSSVIVRTEGLLKEITTITNAAGAIIGKVTSPLMVEFYSGDVAQAIVGALILAVPVSFTEEVWRLGETISTAKASLIVLLSLSALSVFIYQNFYQKHFWNHKLSFFKRTISIYAITFLIAGLFLTIIDKAPWSTDLMLAIKRTIIVTLPASMSAAVADMLK